MDLLFHAPQFGDPGRWIEALSGALPGARVWRWDDTHDAREPPQADYALVHVPPPALLRSQHRLRAVINLGAGVDRLLATDGLPADLPVWRLQDAGKALRMAEYVCHAVIRHARGFDRCEREALERRWCAPPDYDHSAWPVGVMGLGALGAPVAQALAGFGYPTRGWSRSPRSVAGVRCWAGEEALPEFLEGCRILVCLLPLTPQTRGILCREVFQQLLPDAYLVNVGRSAHLVDEDLDAALDDGTLAGATLDVFDTEPLPPQHRWWGDPRITITPHIAANTAVVPTVRALAGLLRALERGEQPPGRVDRTRGY